MSQGKLFVISGPSGAGKGTLVARLVSRINRLWISVSATTRRPREGEVEGVSYFFLTEEEFLRLVEQDGFLEWARYAENLYGTPRDAVMSHISEGQGVVLEIDYQGAVQVREKMPEACFIFIEPPSIAELERRLRERGTEDEHAIDQRLLAARMELSHKEEYDMLLVNDDLDQAASELSAYVAQQMESSEPIE